MSIYNIDDVMIQVRAVRGMLAGLLAGPAAAAAAAAGGAKTPVDFIVDLFDRADSDSLGSYWSAASPWVIRSNHALPRGTAYVAGLAQMAAMGAPTIGFLGGWSDNYSPFSIQTADQSMCARSGVGVFTMSMLKTKIANLYLSPLSSGSMTCKITFDVATAFTNVDTTTTITRAPPTGINTTFNRSVRALLSSVGAAFGNSIGNIAGASLAYTSLPPVTGTSASSETYWDGQGKPGTGTVGPLSLQATFLSTGDFGDAVSVSSPFAFSEGDGPVTSVNSGAAVPGFNGSSFTISQNIVQQFAPGSVTSPIAIGSNTLLIVVVGGPTPRYTISINGVVVYSGPSSLLSAPDRAGLCAYSVDVLAQMLQFNLGVGGVTTFKAWRTDQGEPPNQTGRGIYANGNPIYSDKYHTPILDSAGHISGYTYNPAA